GCPEGAGDRPPRRAAVLPDPGRLRDGSAENHRTEGGPPDGSPLDFRLAMVEGSKRKFAEADREGQQGFVLSEELRRLEDREVPRKGRSLAAPRDRPQQTSVLILRPSRDGNLAGFRRAGRLRSGDFRPNHLEDVPGPAVPRPAEAADRPHLLDI